MYQFINRFRDGAAAVLLAALLAGPAWAGPVNAQTNPAVKIKEIEDAGAALQRGQIDDAYKLLQEAVKKNPHLPPAQLMLARLFLATNEGQRQGRAVLERAAAENP